MADGADQLIIRGVLQPGVTWRARDGAGRRVVLKKIPDDCTRSGRLHPAIALRLTRLREAPMSGLANLIGVQRCEVGVVMVSEFVPGRSMDELTFVERRPYLAEARRLVEAFHRTGLVHGAIGPGNFIISDTGRLTLIDPSPLLYDDPVADMDALVRLDPDDPGVTIEESKARLHMPTLAAAMGLTFIAVAGAAAWAIHVAGRS